jgi:hypothetical protein
VLAAALTAASVLLSFCSPNHIAGHAPIRLR